ncbi:MAG: IPT/TIG domain-containing protein [Planctomycetes bacterium]|nr:IPT/TIG domain-containing protein [Planctomycetota bacterium]
MNRAVALSVALAALGSPARGQLAGSPGYQLLDLAFAAGGGGSCSSGFASQLALPSPAGGPMLSAGYDGELGFLAGNDPQPSNAPVIFGVAPGFGPTSGGTPVAIAGLNFDKLGVGPSVTVTIAGAPATGVSVVSDTQITCLAPPGPSGPSALTVTSPFGSDTLPQGFVHTPALLASPTVLPGGAVLFTNFGPVGGGYQTWFSIFTTSIPLPPFGTLLIGPSFLVQLFGGAYPAPSGIALVPVGVPNDPALSGLQLHFQTAAITAFAPLTIVLTNRSTTTVL